MKARVRGRVSGFAPPPRNEAARTAQRSATEEWKKNNPDAVKEHATTHRQLRRELEDNFEGILLEIHQDREDALAELSRALGDPTTALDGLYLLDAAMAAHYKMLCGRDRSKRFLTLIQFSKWVNCALECDVLPDDVQLLRVLRTRYVKHEKPPRRFKPAPAPNIGAAQSSIKRPHPRARGGNRRPRAVDGGDGRAKKQKYSRRDKAIPALLPPVSLLAQMRKMSSPSPMLMSPPPPASIALSLVSFKTIRNDDEGSVVAYSDSSRNTNLSAFTHTKDNAAAASDDHESEDGGNNVESGDETCGGGDDMGANDRPMGLTMSMSAPSCIGAILSPRGTSSYGARTRGGAAPLRALVGGGSLRRAAMYDDLGGGGATVDDDGCDSEGADVSDDDGADDECVV